jgi:hypothetical protein
MRNFSTSVTLDSTFLVSAHSLDYLTKRDIVSALIVSLEANSKLMTPSEEQVLCDFDEWCDKIHLEIANAHLFQRKTILARPVFAYHNLNTGKSVVVVAAIQEYDQVVCPPMR